MQLSRRQEMVLAALAAESGASFAPVQVQKLFFLLDENVSHLIGGRLFDFEPYDYGPFDRSVYMVLESLARWGLVNVEGGGRGARRYSLTPRGQAEGAARLAALDANAQTYIARLSEWVRSLSFGQLVGAIYRDYPEMRANSVFRD